MEIYIRKHNIWNGTEFITNNHRNFMSYDKCKASIEEYIDDMLDCYPDLKVEIGEEQKYNEFCMYSVTISWKGYYETCKENLTIHREYVY